MNDKVKYGLVAIVIIAAVFGLYAATAKDKTETTTGPASTSTGGVGASILQTALSFLTFKK